MADLARTQKPITARRRRTQNRDFVLPARRETDTPRLEVNAPLVSGPQGEAQELARTLGLVSELGDQAVGLFEQEEARRRQELRAQGALGAATGQPDEAALEKSRAYAQGFYTASARRSVIELTKAAQEAVNERLFNEDDPATLEDINDVLNDLFARHALNEDGTPRNFGDPLAAQIMANGLSEIRAALLPKAADFIRERQNEQLASNVAFNLVNGGMPEIFSDQATPLGAPSPATPGALEAAFDAEFGTTPRAPGTPPAVTPGRLIAPFAGFSQTPSSRIGAPRSGGRTHNGEDFPVPVGTPIVAPMGGTVTLRNNATGGKQVILKMDNGATVGFAHLSDTSAVVDGQRVEAGQTIALSGNTGSSTGPHVHMTVTVDGKKVSPSEYFATADASSYVAPGANEDPNLRARVVGEPVTVAPPSVDFEAVMQLRPPSIEPGEWKKYMVTAIIENAEIAGKPELLEGLWRSTRKDGTPSFNPAEIAEIRDAADRIREQRRIEARRIRNERHEANADLILSEIVNGREPSDKTLIDMMNRDELDPAFVHSIREHREAEREAALREVTAEARAARAEAEREFDLELATLLAERAAGILENATHQDDVKRLQNGEFGIGKSAYRRFRQARAAAQEAVRRVQETNPGAEFTALLNDHFPRAQKTGRLIDQARSRSANATRAAALAEYQERLERGESAFEAYTAVVKKYGGGDAEAALKARRAELQSRM